MAGCGGMWQGSMYEVVGQAYGIDGDMWQGCRHVVGSEDMWQVVGACGRGGGRVWGHVAGVGVCGRVSGLQHGWGHVAGVGIYSRVWGHVAGCGGMWQGVGECGRGGGRVWEHVAGVVVCGRGSGL